MSARDPMKAPDEPERPRILEAGDGPLLAALAAGLSPREADEAAGAPKGTASRRIASDAGFRAELEEWRGAFLESPAGRVAALVDTAADTLAAIMDDEEAPAAARVSAARTVLEYGAELSARLERQRRAEARELATVEEEKERHRRKIAEWPGSLLDFEPIVT